MRSIEWKLRALWRQHGIAIIAYSPFGQAELLRGRKSAALAASLGIALAQLALAWLLAQEPAIAIPKAGKLAHLTECRAAADVRLPQDALAAIDTAFPPPSRASPGPATTGTRSAAPGRNRAAAVLNKSQVFSMFQRLGAVPGCLARLLLLTCHRVLAPSPPKTGEAR
ncbi:MAG: aldo/keto reductase [Burkholderiales bacterium]|nr:aldo/keto reductase [Burkholderiales bacterium]